MNDPGSDMKAVSSANQKKLKGSLQELTRLITSTPVMNPPKGFEARFWGAMSARDRYDICTGRSCPPSRPTAFLSLMIGRYVDKGGKAKAAFNTPATMDASINNLGQVFSHLTVLHKDAEGYLLPEPAAAGERAGIKTYLNKGRAVMVVADNSRPLWLPVSRERYLKAEMAAIARELGLPTEPPAEKQPKKTGKGKNPSKTEAAKTQRGGKYLLIDEGRIWVDPADEKAWVEKSRSLTSRIKDEEDALKEQLQNLQTELDGLTPEQRSMPARVNVPVTAEGVPVLLPPDSSAGVAVVTPNFSYFNPKLPLDALQLVVVQWKFDGNTAYDPDESDITGSRHNRALLDIYKTVDWNRLRAKVTQTAP